MKLRLLVAAAACCLGIGALGCGSGGGNVYVGVGVASPYCCYGGYGGPYAGRPPRYWDDDDLTLAPLEGPLLGEYAADGPDPAAGAEARGGAATR